MTSDLNKKRLNNFECDKWKEQIIIFYAK